MPCSYRRGETIDARSTSGRLLRTVALAELILVLVLIVPAAIAETAAATLAASATITDLGEPVSITGSVSDDPGCIAGRDVRLQWSPTGSTTFVLVDTSVTGSDGSFSFAPAQPNTGRYRARFPETAACLASTSNEALVRVRAGVDAALVAESTRAGTCVEIATSVEPPRPGQSVELERRTSDGWVQTHRLTLDGASGASATPCFTSDDVGVVRLRVRWSVQDLLNETSSSPVLAFEMTQAPWMDAIDEAIGTRRVSVAVGEEDAFLYLHADATPRIPASNEKLLLSMPLYETFGRDFRTRTSVEATGARDDGSVEDLWILGRGDPMVDTAAIASLARKVVDAGVTRVRGRVLGSMGYFLRDWDAPGWNDVSRDYVNRPTALVFERNAQPHPEVRAAAVLTSRLEKLGVRVAGDPGAGKPPDGVETIAFITSESLQHLLAKTLRPSDNFMAEVLGKRLGAQTFGVPGTIAKGAAAIQAWTDARGTDFLLNDSSGLSYANRVTAEGIVRLLWYAEDQPWGADLRSALPTGGVGTLRHRLAGVDVRAKTGSLEDVSTLSGWVKASHTGTWVEFSILSYGMPKWMASSIEDRIVRILQDRLQ